MEELELTHKPKTYLLPEVWIAVIGAAASIAAAMITASCQAPSAAGRALSARTSELAVLNTDVIGLSEQVQQITASGAMLLRLPVGTVVASLLSPQHMAMQGDGQWVPADGRPTRPAWAYTQLTGEARLPDMRGMFLRGVNDSDTGTRAEGADPDGARRPGDMQPAATAAHGHRLLMKAVAFAQGSGPPNFASNIFSEGGLSHPVDGAVQALDGAGNDTRPNNVAVRWYVRVN